MASKRSGLVGIKVAFFCKKRHTFLSWKDEIKRKDILSPFHQLGDGNLDSLGELLLPRSHADFGGIGSQSEFLTLG
jgi:hypothetical protein